MRRPLLVSDHLMPSISDVNFACYVRVQLPALSVLIVSGYAEAEGSPPTYPRLTKPFRSVELEARLAELTSGSVSV